MTQTARKIDVRHDDRSGGHPDDAAAPSAEAAPFWETKTLEEMTGEEWEMLCDGCGRCCLSKLEDIDTGALAFTCVGCTLLNTETGRCRDYANRFSRVSDCLAITPNMARTSAWLPASCAYVRIAQGRGLAWWHPLISGRPETVVEAGVSVAGRVVSEDEVDVNDLEDYIANWPDDEPDDEPVKKAV